MALAAVLLTSKDYVAWRQLFDSEAAAAMRKAGGITSASTHQSKDDPNTALVLLTCASMAEAEAYIANPQLAERWKQAGVVGTPRVEFFQ